MKARIESIASPAILDYRNMKQEVLHLRGERGDFCTTIRKNLVF